MICCRKAVNWDEQITEFKVQTEQNAILKQEYKNNRDELKKSLGENTTLKIDLQKADEERESEFQKIRVALNEKEVEMKELRNKLNDQNVCKICMENEVSTAFLPCGHVVSCNHCSNLQSVRTCPICRVRIEDKINVYVSWMKALKE